MATHTPAATTPATPAPAEPTTKYLRCVIKTMLGPNGAAVPMLPKWCFTLGGKSFAVQTYTRRQNAEGEVDNIPQRGAVEEFLVGGPNCELERVKQAIARKWVRWRNRARLRGDILSSRTCSRQFEAGQATDRFVETKNFAYRPMPEDIPMSDCVAIEEVVPGSDRGPEIPLIPST